MDLVQVSLILGVTLGVVYALAGVGLVVIFRTSGYVSFAQGDIAAVCLYIGLAAWLSGLPYVWVFVLVVLLGALVGGLMWFGVQPFERMGHLNGAMASLGFGLILQGIEGAVAGPEPRAFPPPGEQPLIVIGGVSIRTAELVMVLVSVTVFLVLGIMFRRSITGLAMRAANDNPVAATHVGIPARRLRLISWIMAGALAAVVGLFVAPMYSLTPSSVGTLLVFGFLTIVMGGFDSVIGALVAGILLGVTGNLVAAFVSPQLVTTAVFLLLLVVLPLRPQGLLGRRELVRL